MISHHHETVFIHIPKCGGQSIETLFLDDLGLDWETRAPLLLRANNTPRLGPPRLAHLRACDYTKFKYMTTKQFANYFKFAFVRNPYDRVVSAYNDLRPPFSIDQFVTAWLPRQFNIGDRAIANVNEKENFYYFMRPQVDFVQDDDGSTLVDQVYHLENIDGYIGEILERCKLKSTLRHINRPNEVRVRAADLTENHRQIIAMFYAKDFAAFGYEA